MTINKLLVSLMTVLIVVIAVLYAQESNKASLVAPARPVSIVTKPIPIYPQASEVAILVNQERVKAGLPELIENPKLDASAAAKCADMVKYNYTAHYSPSGVRGHSFITAQFPNWHYIDENLSEYYPDSASAVAGWMGSPAHRAGILSPLYTDVGYAVCHDNWIVQHFEG